MQIDYSLLGKRVANLRKQQGFTQEQLAEKIGLTPIFISHIETNRSVPSLKTTIKLCNALQVGPEELLMGMEPDSRQYLNNDILRKLEACTPEERRLVDGFLELLLSQRQS